MKSILLKYLNIVLAVVALSSCASAWDEYIKPIGLKGESLMQVISENPQTTTFASIVKSAGYEELLSGDKVITVFAPVNDALAGVDMNDVEALRTLVKNHIAYANQTVTEGNFASQRIEMINTKYAEVSGLSLNGIDVLTGDGQYNVTTKNGILHLMNGVIPFRKNIWEYLQSQSGNLQGAFIQSQDEMIMDKDKSIQIGVDLSGRPLYDTVWINQNVFLNQYPINNESETFTYIMLPNSVVERIETKYAKYFAKSNKTVQDSIVRAELIKDCILLPVQITADGKYASVDGVNMDISAANIQNTYECSNGTVYQLADADVKIYENKVKTILIQGENFSSNYSNASAAWSIRDKSYFSDGKDVMLNSRMTYVYNEQVNDTTVVTTTYTNIYFYSDPSQTYTGGIASVNNCYLKYKPVINSVAYKMYWKGYDDFEWHYDPSRFKSPTKFSQKMLISFPDTAVVGRNSSGGIDQNFSTTSCFTSTRFVAGVNEEKQLYRCLLTDVAADIPFFLLRKNPAFTSEDDYFMFFTGSDNFGDKEQIISPRYGEATIMVANTTEYKTTYCGPIIVDYIKLVPVVDPNE